MNKNHITPNKYLLLAMIIIALFGMSGCRTRITNNNEVSNVHYDEDGYLSEMYQMRRDELGLSTAEPPLLPDLGATEAEDEFDNTEDENALQNYEPEPEPEPYVEPTQTTNTNTNTNTNTDRISATENSTDDDEEELVTFFFLVSKGKINEKNSLELTVKKGEMVQAPPKPTREGYTDFTGWYTEEAEGRGEKVDFPCKAEEDTFLYAHWGDLSVTFDANGGEINGDTSITEEVRKGSALKFPRHRPRLKNNIFKGWYTEADGGKPAKEGTLINESVTYYAHWDVDNTNTIWTVIFDANGGTFKDKDNSTEIKVPVKNGAAAIPPKEELLKEGSIFKGWDRSLANVTSNMLVKAVWEPLKYTVSFFSVPGDESPIISKEVEIGGQLTLPERPKKDGYIFKGWQVGDTLYEPGESIDIEGDMEIYAAWEGIVTSTIYWNDIFSEDVEDISNPKCYLDGAGFEDTLRACKVSEIISGETTDTDYKYIIVFAKEDEIEEKKAKYDESNYLDKNVLMFIMSDKSDDKIDIVRKFAILYFLPAGSTQDYKEIAKGLGKEEELEKIIYYRTVPSTIPSEP